MSKRYWHSGPPPHVGWWNASINTEDWMWRWWDGRCWSHGIFDWHGPEIANEIAKDKTKSGEFIQWTTYYPKKARVPRIDPRKQK